MRHLQRKGSHVVVLLMCFGMCSCWIPEKFEATVLLNKDATYTFAYNGTLVFATAAAAARERALSATDEAQLKKEAEGLRREAGFKTVEYLGAGRYRVLFEKVGKAYEPLNFLSICSVGRTADGAIAITAKRPSAKDLVELDRLGVKIDGRLKVSVPFGATIIKQNAQRQPLLWGLLGSYEWEIGSPGAGPEIVVRLPS